MSAKFVVVAAARDGVGKTTFAVNLALSLIKETRGRVLLLDLDAVNFKTGAPNIGHGRGNGFLQRVGCA